MFLWLRDPYTGQSVQLAKVLYCSCSSDGIPDIQGFSSIDVHATKSHGIRRIAHTSLPSFYQNANDNAY